MPPSGGSSSRDVAYAFRHGRGGRRYAPKRVPFEDCPRHEGLTPAKRAAPRSPCRQIGARPCRFRCWMGGEQPELLMKRGMRHGSRSSCCRRVLTPRGNRNVNLRAGSAPSSVQDGNLRHQCDPAIQADFTLTVLGPIPSHGQQVSSSRRSPRSEPPKPMAHREVHPSRTMRSPWIPRSPSKTSARSGAIPRRACVREHVQVAAQ